MNLLTTSMILSGVYTTPEYKVNTSSLTFVNNQRKRHYLEIKSFKTRLRKNNMHNYTKAYYNKDMSHFKRGKKKNH